MDDLVSVVVPVYNAEKQLNRCLESLVCQTYHALEIILVDDGSTDGSPALCRRWARRDNRIAVIRKENGGPGPARNSGIAAATGRFLLFVDSDDYLHDTAVEKCIAAFTQSPADVVIFGRNEVYPDGSVHAGRIHAATPVFHGEEIRQTLLPYMFTYELGFGVGAWGKMYDLNLLKQWNIQFKSKEEIIYEDAFFALELFSRVSSAAVLPECLYFYRKQSDSFSRAFREDRQRQNDLFLQKSMEFIQQAGLPEKLKLHVQARYHGFTLGTLMQIVRSDLPKKEKRMRLREILHSDTLRGTLTKDVCRLDARLPRLFWMLLRLRCYPLCMLLLRVNAYR